MRKFTSDDLSNVSKHPQLYVEPNEFIEKPLWWHKRGLMQTRTGYGRKLTTEKMIHFNGRLRRVYACVQGNAGSCYIVHNGEWVFIN